MRDQPNLLLDEFERAFDEFFNELLIDRWQCGAGDRFERPVVLEFPDHYELRMEAPGIDPARIEVESSGQRVTVRAPIGAGGRMESRFKFSEAIDSDAATARWANDTLVVILPKQKVRLIALKAR